MGENDRHLLYILFLALLLSDVGPSFGPKLVAA